MSTTFPETMTLNEILTKLGYTTRTAPGQYNKHIMKCETIAFTGDSTEVWAWLHVEGHLP